MWLERFVWMGGLLACGLMQGCASYSPAALPKGSSLADARARLGAPSGDYALSGGARRLEFMRGPAGLHTYMVDFDAAGAMVSWAQVLFEENFATIKTGMSRDDVLLRLGHTDNTFRVWSGQQTVWAYRFDSPQCLWFMVGINPEGQVSSTAYGPDPRCEAGDKGDRS